MIINHPLLGPRDAAEFTYLGDANLMNRPAWQDKDASPESIEKAVARFHDYLYLRDNPAGVHRELWYHENGDRSWLVITRDMLSHEILDVTLAKDLCRSIEAVQ